MADAKISALTGATTPLAGTEVVPVVQSGSTKKVAVSDLTAGRAVSAAQLDVDNIRVDGNTISSTNTGGDVWIRPNGVGYARIAQSGNYQNLNLALTNGALTVGGTTKVLFQEGVGTTTLAEVTAYGSSYGSNRNNEFQIATVNGNGNIRISPNGTGATIINNPQTVQSINAQTGTSYQLVASDAGKLVTLSNAAGITLTVPTNAVTPFAIGTTIDLAQMGAGQVTVSSSATLRSTPGAKLRAQYSGASLVKIATDEWLLVGDLTA